MRVQVDIRKFGRVLQILQRDLNRCFNKAANFQFEGVRIDIGYTTVITNAAYEDQADQTPGTLLFVEGGTYK